MSQLDDLMSKPRDPVGYIDPAQQLRALYNDIISNENLYNITDRSQIINPEALLQTIKFLGNTTNHQALYNKYLAAFNNIKSQQEASYQEFYNSTSQQVLRDREAGLNPDILGVQGSQAAQADMNDGSPLDGIPTSEELDAQRKQVNTARFTSLLSFVTSIANLASLPSQISSQIAGKNLTEQQIASQTLSNLHSFEDLVTNEISSRLADSIDSGIEAGDGLDISAWFRDTDLSDILSSYRPDSSPMYDMSFKNVRNRLQKNLAKAYENGKVTADNRGSFAALLADPRVSTDVLIQAAQIRPYMEAQLKMEKARNDYQAKLAEWQSTYQDALSAISAADATNVKNEYDAEYYKQMDAEKMALWKQYQEEAMGIAAELEISVNRNLRDIYSTNSTNLRGYSAAYPVIAKSGISWKEWLIFNEFLHSPDANYSDDYSNYLPNTGSALHDWMKNPTGVPSVPTSAQSFIPPGSAIVR